MTRNKPPSAGPGDEHTLPADDTQPKLSSGEFVPAPRRTKAILARKDGRQLRRMTVYLPPELARRLAIYAAGADIDVSGALAEIVANFLDGRAG